MATFTGSEPVTTLSDNFSFLNNQINDSGAGFTSYAVDTGTANNLIVTLPSAPVAYEAGMMVCTKPAFSCTGPSVINVNALGNIPIVNPSNIALLGGEFSQNALLTLVYDGTSFRIIGPCPLSTVLTAGNVATSTVECAGYSSVSLSVTYTHTTGFTLIPNHIGLGVPLFITITNISGAPNNVGLAPTNAAGASFTVVSGVRAGVGTGGAATTLNGTGVSLVATASFLFVGSAVSATQCIFTY
jgi:hypothetical protein